jgi:mono/diheme cytochrome c family protein
LWAAAAAVAGAQLISRPVPPAEAVERGKQTFVAACGFCHGTDARGGEEGGPDLVRSEIALDDEGGNLIGPVILEGRPNEGMPAFTLSKDQIADIAAFLRNQQQAAINRNQYEILDVMTGDAEAGRAFFNGAGGCAACHSATGDLAGVGAKYPPATLQTRMLMPRGGRGGTPKPTTVTVRPRSGAAVSGTLESQDDFVVALRDEAGYYRSFPRDQVTVEINDPLEAHARLLRQYTDKTFHDVLTYLGSLR